MRQSTAERCAILQITQTGVAVTDTARLSALREAFAQQHCAVLPQLLDACLLERIRQQLATTEFRPTSHVDIAGEEVFAKDLTATTTSVVVHLLYMLLNSPPLFQAMQQITGCPPIGSFAGRVYRTLPNSNHHLSWHDDNTTGNHLIGISINLSPEAYSGGVFQLRQTHAPHLLSAIAPTAFGDAHIFRIAPDLQHRVTRVDGCVARTMGTGWFDSQPDRATLLKSLPSPGSAGR